MRALELAAGKAIADPGGAPAEKKLLGESFHLWAANDERFQPLAQGDVLLAELKPLSKDLAAIGSMGLRILDYLAAGKAAPANWIAAQYQELTRMARPSAEVRLAATRPVKLLLDELARKSK